MNLLAKWWHASGMSAAGSSGRAILDDAGKKVVIYDHVPSATTIVVAGSEEARNDLRAWFTERQHGRTS